MNLSVIVLMKAWIPIASATVYNKKGPVRILMLTQNQQELVIHQKRITQDERYKISFLLEEEKSQLI